MNDSIWDSLEEEIEPDQGSVEGDLPPSLSRLVPGELVWNDSGSVYVSVRSQSISGGNKPGQHRHNPDLRLGNLIQTFQSPPELANLRTQDCAFVDCETTGLARNSLAFLIGVGLFERHEGAETPCASPAEMTESAEGQHGPSADPTHFVVRQLLVHHPREEAAALQFLHSLLQGRRVCVTFNGDRFDIPLLRSRIREQQFHFPELPLEDPFSDEELFSLDLLPLARKVWRRRIGSCALSNCELRILGVRRTHADVSGAQIPGIYMQYLETGKASELSRVFYHNEIDILSMSFLLAALTKTSRSAQSAELRDLDGVDALALGCLSQESMRLEDAERLFEHAVGVLGGSEHQNAAFRELGLLRKRQGRWDEAVSTWERWFTSTATQSPDPCIELAKYHEWRSRDLKEAEMFTRWAIHINDAAPSTSRKLRVREELLHRLNRIARKRA